MWLSPVDSGLSEEFESFARCLMIAELVGLDCVEQYLPHRVAMQFGIDQFLPACVARANKTASIVWSKYIKSIGCANLYVPSRLFEADVTTRYSEWWKQSVSRLQCARKGVLQPKRTFRVFKISHKKTSKRAKGFHFTSSKIQSKKLDGIKKGDCAYSSHPSFAFKSSEKLLESNGGKKTLMPLSLMILLKSRPKNQWRFQKKRRMFVMCLLLLDCLWRCYHRVK
ncbi:hypothetical protein LWI29_024052 [Acer saccharum]|uniref:Aminotransferase-like plant mobile domain-containing protein n=1 Tax=Acer saccharum TaxID=4024 RepID=A0AA39T4P7_ACESA|nr:hypothetical protein LWI29_024052 [Acer saccharum]